MINALLKLFSSVNKFNSEHAIAIGNLLFDDKAEKFRHLIEWYTKDQKQFVLLYGDLFEDMGMQTKHLHLIDMIRAFGLDEEKILNIDWRGEENEGEIQCFCEEITGQTFSWSHVQGLEDRSRENTAQLFHAIQQDLLEHQYQLAFVNSYNDSYELIILPSVHFEEVKKLDKKLLRSSM